MLNREQIKRLYQYAFSLTAERASAEDLLQSALEKMIKQPRAKHSPAYARKIIRNQYIDHCRRLNLVSFEALDETTPVMLDPANLEKQLIDEQIVEQLFSTLNSAEREVLFLWAVVGYSASEIAVELQQSRGTVLSRLYRVKQKVVANMQEDLKSLQAGGPS